MRYSTGDIRSFWRSFTPNQLIERPWIWSGIGLDVYERTFGRYYRRKYGRELSERGLEIDPFRLYQVDPSEISKRTGRQNYDVQTDFGRVEAGDWDENVNERRYRDHPDHVLDLYVAERLEESTHYESLYQHFIEGEPWEETELYDIVSNQIEEGCSFYHGCATESELKQYLNHVDQVFENIREHGYRTQRELVSGRRTLTVADYRHLYGNEVSVDIGRDGGYYFVEGRHRLTIAKLLDLETVPVVFLVRHSEWVERLKSGEVQAHPDRASIEPSD